MRLNPGPRTIIAATLLAGFATMLAFNLPGQMSFDSIEQLHDGRFGFYRSWHPPVMAWLLGLGDALWRGPGLFVIADATLLFGVLISLAWLRPRPSLAAAAVALVLVAMPPLLLYQGIVWKDVLFANASVAGFVLLAHAAANWRRPVERIGFIVASFSLLGLAAMARQNGFVILAFGAAALGFIAARERSGRAILYGLAGFLLAAGLAAGGDVLLAAHGDHGAGARDEFKLLEVYDLIGGLTRAPRLPLGALTRADPRLVHLMQTDGVRLYSPERNDTLEAGSPALWNALEAAPPAPLFSDWSGLIFGRPILYLETRAAIFRWVFLTPDIARCVPIFTGVDSQPADELRDLKMAARDRPRDVALGRYAAAFLGTPIFSHPAYLVAAFFALILLWRRRSPSDIAIGFMLLAAFAFTASFFAVSIACDYRYLYFPDLATLAALLYLALDLRLRAAKIGAGP